MHIERIYQPDVKYQLQAILLLLRIRLPSEFGRSNHMEVRAITPRTPSSTGRKMEGEEIHIEEVLS